jgi:hypothetical protein
LWWSVGKLSREKRRGKWRMPLKRKTVLRMNGERNWFRILSSGGFWYLKCWSLGFSYRLYDYYCQVHRSSNVVGFEVLSAVFMNGSIFWAATPCSLLKVNRRFWGTCLFRLHGRRISQARKQREAGNKQRRLTFNGLHGAIYQKIKLFIKYCPNFEIWEAAVAQEYNYCGVHKEIIAPTHQWGELEKGHAEDRVGGGRKKLKRILVTCCEDRRSMAFAHDSGRWWVLLWMAFGPSGSATRVLSS